MPTFDQGIPMKHKPTQMVPRGLVWGMFALMLGSLALVSYAKFTGQEKIGVLYQAPIEMERSIVLSGDRNGAYSVLDLDGTVIAASSDDLAGFIGIVGLVVKRERFTQGVPSDAPVRIARRVDGHIAIIDDTTDMTIELVGYGADNVAAFANLLN